jgi:lipopolysaccharide transport system permease protein
MLLIFAMLVFGYTFHITLFLAPLVLLPVLFLSLAVGWLLSSFGVFLRDIGYSISVVSQVLFFLTPIFYPITAVPPSFQFFMMLNPLTVIVENFRKVVLWGLAPDWLWLSLVLAGSFVLMMIGYVWFMKSRRSFADVL